MIDWRSRFFLFIAFADASLIMMGSDFGLIVWDGGSPITPEQYGQAVYDIPALVWVAFQCGGAMLGVIGAVMVAACDVSDPLPLRGRIGALVCGVGNLALMIMFSVFALLSRDAEAGILLHSLTKFPGTWIYGAFAVLSLRLVIWGDEIERMD